MYRLTVYPFAGAEPLDTFMLSDEEAGSQPFGVNPVGTLQVNLQARGLHLYAASLWGRVKLTPAEALKVVD